MQASLLQNLNNPHVFECELKQVTPMIHFQGNQPGATLRATQVKPMLDRFLLREYGETVPKDWLMDKKNKEITALKYQMTILPNSEPRRSDERRRLLNKLIEDKRTSDYDKQRITEKMNQLPRIPNALTIPGAFFANMPSGNTPPEKMDWILTNAKELLWYDEPLTLRIYCRNEKLLDFIKENLKDFFLLHSFGTRTSKGFGSFVTGDPTEDEIENLYSQRYGMFLRTSKKAIHSENVNNAIKYATGILQLMKSGINHSSKIDFREKKKIIFSPKNGYEKGHLIHYYQSLGIGSDKRFVKSENIPLHPKNGQFDTKSKHSSVENMEPHNGDQFIRALLGLADKIEFRDNMFSDTVKIISEDGSIERFKCPITVRIISNHVYFLPEKYPDHFLGRKFLFLNSEQAKTYKADKDKKNDQYENLLQNQSLQIPCDFNLKAFLSDFAKTYNGKILKEIKTYTGLGFKAITSFNDKPLEKGGAGK